MIPIPTRILGKLLRGKATPFQIFAAAILGGLLGFMPGFVQAPGLVLLLIVLLLVLNANLFFAAFVGTFAKLLSLLLTATGVQFEVGMFLIDGPLQPLARLLINAPALAWAGFDNYVAVGGLLLGLAFGIAAGIGLVKMIDAYRGKLATLEKDNARYQKYASTWYAKLLAFVLIGGGHGKKTYDELKARRVGLPVRPSGIALAALLVGLVALLQFLFKEQTATAIAKSQLERMNGATVDLARTELDLAGGEATIVGIALADPARLTHNSFAADEITVDFDTSQLLRRRYVIDTVIVDSAIQGGERRFPGRIIGRPPQPAPEPPAPEGETEPKTIEDYIRDAETWKERLARLKEIIDRLRESRGEDPTTDTPDPEAETERLPLAQRLRLRARDAGYAHVYATHLIEDFPRLTVRKIDIRGVVIAGVEGLTLELEGEWLSTDPSKLETPLAVNLRSADDSITGGFHLPPVPDNVPTIAFAYRGLDAQDALDALSDSLADAFAGGTIDLELNADLLASASGTAIEAPLSVTLRNSTVTVPGVGPTQIEQLLLPLRLSGPLDNPSILLDESDLADSLAAAGKAEAARRVREATGELLEDASEQIRDALPENVRESLPGTDGIRERLPGRLRNPFGGGAREEKREDPSPDGDGEP